MNFPLSSGLPFNVSETEAAFTALSIKGGIQAVVGLLPRSVVLKLVDDSLRH